MTTEKDIAVGNVGDVDLKTEKGIVSVTFKIVEPKTKIKVTIGLEIDVNTDLELLKSVIVAKWPTAAPFIDMVFAAVEKAIAGI